MHTQPFRFLCRSLLPLLAAVALWSPLQAQTSRTFFGLTGGATLSDFSDDFGGVQTTDRWGGTAGIIFGVRTANWASIALEPAWTSMGGSELSLGYIEVPLTLGGVARDREDNFRYGAYTGIAPAFKISCNDDEALLDVCDQAKGTVWFLPVGVRFLRRASGSSYFGIDVKYSFPLGDSFDNSFAEQRTWAFRLIFLKGGAPR